MTQEIKEYSIEAIRDLAEGKPIEEIKQEEAMQDGEVAVVEEEETEETEQHVEEPKKKPSIREEMVQYRKELQEERRQRQETERMVQELVKKNAALEELARAKLNPKEEIEEDEPIDAPHFKKVDEKFNKTDETLQMQEVRLQEMELAQQHPIYVHMKAHVIQTEAGLAMAKAKAAGQPLTEKQALEWANKRLQSDIKAVQNNGGNFASYVVELAQGYGFQVQPEQPKTPKKDMKATNELRDSAGAPAVKKAAVSEQSWDMDSYIAQRKKERGIA